MDSEDCEALSGLAELYMETKQEPKPKILEGKIAKETEKAFLFKFNDSENWLPKSQITINKKKEGVSVENPAWLWDKMNQIEE